MKIKQILLMTCLSLGLIACIDGTVPVSGNPVPPISYQAQHQLAPQTSHWQRVSEDQAFEHGGCIVTDRLPVSGGFVFRATTYVYGGLNVSICFVPDVAPERS